MMRSRRGSEATRSDFSIDAIVGFYYYINISRYFDITLMGTLTLNHTATEYKVADMSLADWGRKEISVAEHEMPGLMSIRRKYAPERPLAGGAVPRPAPIVIT